MVSTGWRAQISRFRQQYSLPLAVFGLAMTLLAAGDWWLQQALASVEQPSLELVVAALGRWQAVLGISLICAALGVWMAMLARWQLSFFYPLWGLSAVLLILARWASAGTWPDPLTLWGICLVCLGVAIVIRGGHS